MNIGKRLVLCLMVVVLAAMPAAVHAEDVNKTIQELMNTIAGLQTQGSTLTKQISLLDSQIKLTTLRISDTKGKIGTLEGEIGSLSNEIEKLETLKTKRLELVLHRIPQTYKRSAVSEFGWVFFGTNFTQMLQRIKFITRVQEEDTQLYKELQLAQINYNESKDTREKKKQQLESLRKDLEQHTVELTAQQHEKQVLLAETKQSEVVYQQLLAQALAEKQALTRAVVDSVKVGPVKRGDPIALVGNTGYPGCSTGAHLHFEVQRSGTWVDPSQYLSSKTVNDEQNGGTWTVGSGSWSWPLSDTVLVTQHFGKTPWSWRYSYSGGIHTGFDMQSTGGDVIRAPADGTLYASSQNCGSSSVIKIKYIDYGGGVQSFFLHVQ
jgi:peptidoglycan hydrolase CwlO-like protein